MRLFNFSATVSLLITLLVFSQKTYAESLVLLPSEPQNAPEKAKTNNDILREFGKLKCTLQGHNFYPNHYDIEAGPELSKMVDGWQDCFKFAVLTSQNFAFILQPREGKIGGYTTFHWNYDDSLIPFMDTSGKVTKYSNPETPTVGNDLHIQVSGR